MGIMRMSGQMIWTVAKDAEQQLLARGVPADDVWEQVMVLLLYVLGVPRAQLLARWRDEFPSQYGEAWTAVMTRRLRGEPVQYITGEQWFYGMPFQVNAAVLVPRPETELLVEAVVEAARELHSEWQKQVDPGGSDDPGGAGDDLDLYTKLGVDGMVGLDEAPQHERQCLLVDVGTGSGAIAVACDKMLPDWIVAAVDISAEALAVADANARANGVIVHTLQGDLLAPILARGIAPDVIVSNPPYIPSAEIAGLQREVAEYEPRLALDGGADGLTPYRRLVEQIQHLPRLPRVIGLEMGIHQAPAVAELIAGLTASMPPAHQYVIRIIEDYAGIARHILATR
jgi:release factor glutamine methyltransferase